MKTKPSNHFAIDRFIGDSAWTERTRKRVVQVAKYKYSVLVTGPSGTGKEVIARAVHAHSDRSEHPFIPVNCAAIPESLFAAQLFGHTKGAFTGAQYDTLGCFRSADQGTIFLDEIGDLDLECQAKLLRVLQEKIVVPVGGQEEIPVNVRTVAATNRNLMEDVRAGRFRLDLYYRLNVLSIETVGLRDRPEDIPPLARHFLAKTAVECGLPLKVLSPEAMELLLGYAWPGNVRELENFIERAVVHTEDDVLWPEAFAEMMHGDGDGTCGDGFSTVLPGGFTPGGLAQDRTEDARRRDDGSVRKRRRDRDPTGALGVWPTLERIERRHLIRTLKKTFFNQSAAARLLGIDRKLLARKIRRHQIKLPHSR